MTESNFLDLRANSFNHSSLSHAVNCVMLFRVALYSKQPKQKVKEKWLLEMPVTVQMVCSETGCSTCARLAFTETETHRNHTLLPIHLLPSERQASIQFGSRYLLEKCWGRKKEKKSPIWMKLCAYKLQWRE